MSSTKSRKHPHKYYRVPMSTGAEYEQNMIWTCALPDCSHHMPKHYERMLLGKSFFCWQCGSSDILRENHLKGDKQYYLKEDKYPSHPICVDCASGMPKVDEDDIETILNSLK